jgi:hypothetical protein
MEDMGLDVCDPLQVYHKYHMVQVLDDMALRKKENAVRNDDSNRAKVPNIRNHSKMALDEDRVVYDNNDRGNVLDADQILYNQATNGNRESLVQTYHNYINLQDACDSLGNLHCLCYCE